MNIPFKTSDKVVCVDAVPGTATLLGQYDYPNGYVKHGTVYVVEQVREIEFREGARTRLIITGIPVIWRYDQSECGWQPERFRRLEEIKEENRIKQSQGIEA